MAKASAPTKSEAVETTSVTVTDEEIREAIDGTVKKFKGRADRTQVANALREAAELVNRGDWANGDE